MAKRIFNLIEILKTSIVSAKKKKKISLSTKEHTERLRKIGKTEIHEYPPLTSSTAKKINHYSYFKKESAKSNHLKKITLRYYKGQNKQETVVP